VQRASDRDDAAAAGGMAPQAPARAHETQ
jgi:hypothetical protein